ncbi:MAG TPA: hypothetical protein VMN39_11640 [Longimicrobiaceae bacterium]|nr:hypothetical protein [Longimicrobiaceae bacterium]
MIFDNLNSWLARRPRHEAGAARAVAIAIIVLLVAAMGRSSTPAPSWGSSGAETRGVFLCPPVRGEPRIILSPTTGETDAQSQIRRLTILHEEVHVRQARDYPSCWLFNAAMRLDANRHLRFEAAAHCAEIQQQLAWLDRALSETPFWRSSAPGRAGYRDRWWSRAVTDVSEDLLVKDGHYGRIANLGEATVVREVREACGPVVAYPAQDHPLLDVPSVRVIVGDPPRTRKP